MTDNQPATTPSEMQYYSTTQVSKMVSVTPATVRSWIDDGKLKAIQISNRYRVSHEDLKKFLEKRYPSAD